MITKTDIKLARSLSDKAARKETGLFVAEGDKIIGEILDSDFAVEKLYTTSKSLYSGHSGSVHVSENEMGRLSHLKTPSSSFALVHIPSYSLSLENGDKLLLALDDIQDPGNLGTIIRLADWFGIEDILCSMLTADCFNPKVIQATMGAMLRVRLHYTELPDVLEKFAAQKTEIYGTFIEGTNIYEAPLTKRGIIVMGNEGRGISDRITSLVTQKLSIPSYPIDRHTSESLNVATATAIICSEFRRR